MNEHEILQTLEKFRYQIKILGQTVNSEKYPVEALIMVFDWGPEDLDKAHDIFDRWDKLIEQGGEMKSGKIESEFDDSLGIGYQGLKTIILAFWRNGQWTNVCEAYVDSFGKAPSVEFHEISHRKR